MATQKILIIGASGGPQSPPIRVSTRNISKTSFPQNVEVVQGDLEDESSYPRLFNGIDRVFLYINEKAPLPRLLSVAKNSGVTYIVLLSSMTVEFDPEGSIGKLHAKAEDAIKEAGLAYTFLRPRNFASNSKRWAPTMAKTGKLWITYPNSHTAPVAEEDMAAVALQALTTNALHNQAIPLCGPVSITQQEQVEAINRLRVREGKQPIDLVIIPPEVWKEKMMVWLKEDYDEVFVNQLLKWWKQSDGVPEKIQSSERVTGKPSLTYEEWLEINQDAFLKD